MLRQVMLAGKSLLADSPAIQTDANKVVGCEAAVWMGVTKADSGKRIYSAYSPAKIVRGLLAIILEKANALAPAEQQTFDYQAYLAEIGLQRFLSPSRQNGLAAVIRRIQQS